MPCIILQNPSSPTEWSFFIFLRTVWAFNGINHSKTAGSFHSLSKAQAASITGFFCSLCCLLFCHFCCRSLFQCGERLLVLFGLLLCPLRFNRLNLRLQRIVCHCARRVLGFLCVGRWLTLERLSFDLDSDCRNEFAILLLGFKSDIILRDGTVGRQQLNTIKKLTLRCKYHWGFFHLLRLSLFALSSLLAFSSFQFRKQLLACLPSSSMFSIFLAL